MRDPRAVRFWPWISLRRRLTEFGLHARLRLSNLRGAGIAVDDRRSAPKNEVRITRGMSRRVYLSAPRRGSRRSDGVPPVRENLSRRADEVAGRSPGNRAAPGLCLGALMNT